MKTLILLALIVLTANVYGQTQLDPIPEHFRKILEVEKFSSELDDNNKEVFYGTANGYYVGTKWRNHGKLTFVSEKEYLSNTGYTKELNEIIKKMDDRIRGSYLTRDAKVIANFTDGVPNGPFVIINYKTGKKIFEANLVSYINEEGKLTYKPQGKVSTWDPETGKPLSTKHFDSKGELTKFTKYSSNKGVIRIATWNDDIHTLRWEDDKGNWQRRCSFESLQITYSEKDKKMSVQFSGDKVASKMMNSLLENSVFKKTIENQTIQKSLAQTDPTEFVESKVLCKNIMQEFKDILVAEINTVEDSRITNCSNLQMKCDNIVNECESEIAKAETNIANLHAAIVAEDILYAQNFLYSLYDLFVETEADKAEKALPGAENKLKKLKKKNNYYQQLASQAHVINHEYEKAVEQCTNDLSESRFFTAKDINVINQVAENIKSIDTKKEDLSKRLKMGDVLIE